MDVTVVFRRLLLMQVLLAFTAFCLAEGQWGILLVAGALATAAWWFSEGPNAKALPHWAILLGSLVAVGGLVLEMSLGQNRRVVAPVGHFTIWLQVLQLFARKTNRDYALIMVLSLLQIIGACVERESLVVGTLLLVYCVTGLFTVLLFQFQITSEHVRAANQAAAPPDQEVSRPDAVAGRGYRWHLRLGAVLIGAVCMAAAAVVFLLGPRPGPTPWVDPGEGAEYAEVGAGDYMQMGSASPQAGSSRAVLSMAVRVNGRAAPLPEELNLLRRCALDRYDRHTGIWTRSLEVAERDAELPVPEGGAALGNLPPGSAQVEADITVRPGATAQVPLLFPPAHIAWRVPREPVLRFNAVDQVLSMGNVGDRVWGYTVSAPWSVPSGVFAGYAPRGTGLVQVERAVATPGSGETDSEPVRALAHHILADRGIARDPRGDSTESDRDVAAALCAYLGRGYTYSLDHPAAPAGSDPVEDFLLRSHQGHCEQFAGALAALARAAGLRARVVLGYYVHEYNRTGGVYLVRARDAHAWTEVDCGPLGWQAFDATPPGEVAREHAQASGHLGFLGDLYDYLDFHWSSAVAGYDQGTRHLLVEGLAAAIRTAASDPRTWLGTAVATAAALVRNWQHDVLTYTLMALVIFFMFLGLGVVLRILILRRRRLSALQLTRLPPDQRRQLSRQLGFYLVMLETLDRYGYHRPAWQTPAGFAHALAADDTERFEPVVALTEQFYQVRFGSRTLDGGRQALIRTHLRQLEERLALRPARSRPEIPSPLGRRSG
jgi:hypothetical protein